MFVTRNRLSILIFQGLEKVFARHRYAAEFWGRV
jgi:hypothetical protein